MKYVVHIDSRDRDLKKYPSPSEYRVYLPRSYSNVTHARLLSARIPGSVANAHGLLIININGIAKEVQIPTGNYTPSSLCTSLESALQLATGVVWSVVLSATYTCTISNADGIEFRVAPSSLARLLGFTSEEEEESSGGSLKAPLMVNIEALYEHIILDIEELNTIGEGSMDGGEVGPKHFASLSQSASYIYGDIDTSHFPLLSLANPVEKLHRLRIRMRYHDGRLVDFSGANHSVAIELVTRDNLGQVGDALGEAGDAGAPAADPRGPAAVVASAAIAATRSAETMNAAAESALHCAKSLIASLNENKPAPSNKIAWMFGAVLMVALLVYFFVRTPNQPLLLSQPTPLIPTQPQ